jgi:hypothetical protein
MAKKKKPQRAPAPKHAPKHAPRRPPLVPIPPGKALPLPLDDDDELPEGQAADGETDGELEGGAAEGGAYEPDYPPRVVLARLSDLVKGKLEPKLAPYGSLAVWLLLEDDADLADVFLTLPEKPLPRAVEASIFAIIRAFAADKTDALQAVLGVTDSIEIGFHTSATVPDVAAAFDADGFEVLEDLVRDGELAADE